MPRLERKRDRLVRSVTRHISSARQPVNSVQRCSERLVAMSVTSSRAALRRSGATTCRCSGGNGGGLDGSWLIVSAQSCDMADRQLVLIQVLVLMALTAWPLQPVAFHT